MRISLPLERLKCCRKTTNKIILVATATMTIFYPGLFWMKCIYFFKNKKEIASNLEHMTMWKYNVVCTFYQSDK